MTSDSDPLLSRERGSDEEGSDSAVMQAKRIAPFLGSVVIMIPAFSFPVSRHNISFLMSAEMINSEASVHLTQFPAL